jgi:hypothetical protein
LRSVTAKAVTQAVIYSIFSVVIVAAWPFQRLDARIPLAAWVPELPRYRSAQQQRQPTLRKP